MTDAEAKLPSFLTQCKRHKQDARSYGIMRVGVAGVIMGLLLHGDMLRCMEKKRTNSDPFMESTDKHSIYTRWG